MRNESIPVLFPGRLLDICRDQVLHILDTAGHRVRRRSDQTKPRNVSRQVQGAGSSVFYPGAVSYGSSIGVGSSMNWSAAYTPGIRAEEHYTSTQEFSTSVKDCQEFLSTHLAGPVIDALSAQAGQDKNAESPGSIFTFMVLCGDRLGRLVVHQHAEVEDEDRKNWGSFASSETGRSIIISSLSNLFSLSCLTIHHVATNDMLYIVSTVCSRLVVLDISYSHNVTDIGLVHLCGVLMGNPGCVYSEPQGCKFLREIYFNPQSSSIQEMIMPRVTACLLRHLPWLQVVDLSNLHTGIEHYYRGSTHRQSRVKSLNLVHYTGSDRLAEVMEICPKLRTFKLFVTAQLPQLGYTLQCLKQSLDQVTLVYTEHTSLLGLQEFLNNCGNKIIRLEIDCTQETIITCSDLICITTKCPQIETLSFTNFHVNAEVDYRISHSPVPTIPAPLPFLTAIRFNNVYIEEFGKDVFRYLLGGAADLESINISLHSAGYFFSDFLLDDILLVNNLSHLQEFILRDGALTLISALRLISSRPKLRTIGELLHWDVEKSELDTFIQILRRARSLNLLQDIHIF